MTMKEICRVILKSIGNSMLLAVSGIGLLPLAALWYVFSKIGVTDDVIIPVIAVMYTAVIVAYTAIDYRTDETAKEKREFDVYKNKVLADLEVGSRQLEKSKREFASFAQKSRDELDRARNDFNQIINETKQNSPWLSAQIADYQYLQDKKAAADLKNKKHPAVSAAQKVNEIAKEKRELIRNVKMLEYQLRFLEDTFPWLVDYEALTSKEAIKYAFEVEPEYDEERNWLSPEEYSRLSSTEKNQLVLDRWRNRKNKSAWEVGVDYERYVGYIYESSGFTVDYEGALKGVEDRGVDIIAKQGSEVLVIQCKRYSAAKSKHVHENTVAQIYGVAKVISMENPEVNVTPVIYTSSSLADEAKRFAKYLGILVFENIPLPHDYPIIKCNTGKSGERIYHMPFDQQYDRIKIAGKPGAQYVSTVVEAEKLGYRRAYKWRGN